MADKEIDLIEKTRGCEILDLAENIRDMKSLRVSGICSVILFIAIYIPLFYFYIDGRTGYDLGDNNLYILCSTFATLNTLVAINCIFVLLIGATRRLHKTITEKEKELYLLVTR